jgi:predicted nuclease of predicted toxin-antitoxin system
LLAHRFPGCSHVQLIGLAQSSDGEVWRTAAALQLAVLTKDNDFQLMSVAVGQPPKVVSLAIGNCSTAEVAELVLGNADAIDSFLAGPDALLILSR